MAYDENHSKEDCDSCGKRVGRENLFRLPFLYCDKNDKFHPDRSRLVGRKPGSGYRQYKVCKNCYDIEYKRTYSNPETKEKMRKRYKELYGEKDEHLYPNK